MFSCLGAGIYQLQRVRDEGFNGREVRFTLCKILLVSQWFLGLKALRSISCAIGLWVTYESGEKVHQVKSGGGLGIWYEPNMRQFDQKEPPCLEDTRKDYLLNKVTKEHFIPLGSFLGAVIFGSRSI